MQAIPFLNQQLFEATGTGTCWVDAKGNITFANSMVAEMLGCTVDVLIGCPLDGAVQDAAPIKALLAHAAQGRPSHCEPVLPRAASKTHSLSLIAHPILVEQGGPTNTLVTFALYDAAPGIPSPTAASEEQFRSLFESFDEGVATIEVQFDDSDQAIDYRFLAVNRAYHAMSGMGTEVVGKCISEVMPDIDPSVIQRMGNVALTGDPTRFEDYIRPLDRWFEFYLFRVGHQRSRTVVAVFKNITERKRRERLQAFLLTLSDALRPHVDPQEIQVLAANFLGEHLQVNIAHNGEVRGEHVHVSHSYADGLAPMVGVFHAEDFGKRLIDGHRAGKLQVCVNTANDPLFDVQERKTLAAAHVGAYIAVPLVKEGVWVGVLSVLNIQPRDWTPTEIEAVQEVAERTWAAVERTRAERALSRSEAKYRSLFESMDEGVSTLEVLFDEQDNVIDYIFLETNAAHGAISGVTSDVIGKRISEVMPDLDPTVIQRIGKVALTGESIRFEDYIRPLDRWFEIYLSKVGHQGSRTVVAVFKNITERKRRERLQAFLLTLSDALRPLVDPQEIQMQAADRLGEHLQANHVHYGEVRGEYVHISHSYANGLAPMVGAFHAEDFGKRLIDGHRAGRLQVCVNTTSDPLFEEQEREVLAAAHVGAYIAVPLVKECVWVGVLSVQNIHPRDWAPTEVEAVQEVAERTWAAVERTRAERALSESEERLKALIANLPGGAVFVVDTELRYLIAEGEAIAQAGLKSGDFLGKTVREAMPENLATEYDSFYRKALAGEHFEHEHEAHGHVYLTRGLPLRSPSGGIYAVLAASFDITERKRAEAESRDVDRRKDEFLAMLSHELRNPLAAISSATQLMKHLTANDATAQRPREVIERQLQHLTRLVDDLLDMSRLTWGKINLRHETLSLANVLHSAIEASRPLIDARSHQLTITLLSSAVQVTGDFTRLVQVFGNLLNNAAKYTEPGGHIAMHAAIEGKEAIVRVRDNGCGLFASLLPHVFELFTQAGRSLDRSQGGLGVGLALVCSLVKMHGGAVEAHSAGLGQGSEFVVRLPLAVGRRVLEHPATNVAAAQTPALTPSMKVLVVEDNANAAEMLALLLRHGGDEVRLAHDGLTALDQARDFQPQVVSCDIGLPGLSGYEVATRLRQQPEFRDTLLVGLSGYGRDEDRRLSQLAGFDHYLTKPVDPKALADLLQRRRLV